MPVRLPPGAPVSRYPGFPVPGYRDQPIQVRQCQKSYAATGRMVLRERRVVPEPARSTKERRAERTTW
eukprot:1330005-Rhodomonas_salina.2